jgi:hypothetical protein
MVPAGCVAHSLSTEDRARADKLIKSLDQIEKRFTLIDMRLADINRSARSLRGELSGVRQGTIALHDQLQELAKRFGLGN